jgi:glycosyltransferase involved in cell wall biosynthesis
MDRPPPRRISVLLCIPNLTGGGAEKSALNLSRALAGSGFHVTLFAHEKRGSLVETLLPGDNVVFANHAEYSRKQLPGLLLRTLKVASKADVVIGANEGRATFLAWCAAKLLRKPLIAWLHSNWEEFGKVVSWRQRLALRVYTQANAVVSVSEGAAQAFRRLHPIAPERMHVIHNGLSGDTIRRLSQEPLPAMHASLFAGPVVLTVGRLSPEKNQALLIKAHKALCERGIIHQLVLLGDGPLREELPALARNLGVADTVHFLGFHQNPYPYLRRATVFALSSNFEGFAIVIAEALVCGTPVVSVDCPSGPAEILDHGRYGELVPPGDAEALADGLGRLLTNPARREELAKLAKERSTIFEMDRTVSQWKRLIEEVAGQVLR